MPQFEIETTNLESILPLPDSISNSVKSMIYSFSQQRLETALHSLLHHELKKLLPGTVEPTILSSLRELIVKKTQNKLLLIERVLSLSLPVSITSHQGGNLCSVQEDLLDTLVLRNCDLSKVQPHLTTNYSLESTWIYLNKLEDMGIKRLLLIGGDKPKKFWRETYKRSKDFCQGKDLIRLVNDYNAQSLHTFIIEAGSNPYQPLSTEKRRLELKLGSGRVDGFKTQPIDYTQPRLFEEYQRMIDAFGISDQVTYSLFYATSLASYSKLKECGCDFDKGSLPSLLLSSLEGANGNAKEFGQTFAVENCAKGYTFLLQNGIPDNRINFMGVPTIRRYEQIMERVNQTYPTETLNIEVKL